MKMTRRLLCTVCLCGIVALTCLLTASKPAKKDKSVAESKAQAELNVVILGDSQTWIGGDDCDKPKGWNKWLKDRLQPTSIKSYARSGATWTNTAQTVANTEENIGSLGNNNVIYNQVLRLKEALDSGQQVMPQLIIVFAGANDAWFAEKRPQLFDRTVEQAFDNSNDSTLMQKHPNEVLTLAESVRHDCLLLQQCCPTARLLLMTPMEMTKVPVERVTRVSDIIAGCGKRLKADIIRMDRNSCVKSSLEKKQLRMTTDGVHTSVEGARRNGYYVAKVIKQLISDN